MRKALLVGALWLAGCAESRITTPSGESFDAELSPAEVAALGGLVGMVYGVIEMFEHLLEPVAGLLGVSVSL